MTAVLERLREQLDALQGELEADAAERSNLQATLEAQETRHRAELLEMQRQCAEALEQAYGDAARRVESDRLQLIGDGKRQERERLLLLISLVGENVREGGGNALALSTLRRMVEGDESDG